MLFATCTENEKHASPDYFSANTHRNRTNTKNLPAFTHRLTSYVHPPLFLTYNNGNNTFRCNYWPIQLVSGTDFIAGIFIFSLLNFSIMENIILNTFKRDGDKELITSGFRVVNKTANNPVFPDPPEELAKIKELLPKFQNSVSDAKGRDIEVINLKNEQKALLITHLTALAEYVTITCNGDRGKLLSSGFQISGERLTPEEDSEIKQLEVELGPPGEATTKVKRLRRARAYMHQYTTELPTAETIWASVGSKQPYYTFSGLKSTVKYYFRVVVISQSGLTVHSPVVTRVIQ